MQIHITSEPCLLLETIELLFGFTNHVSAQELTAAGRWCIPAEAMQTMLDTACEGLSPENPELQFFFAREALDRDPPGCTCIARNIGYSFQDYSCASPEKSLEVIRREWAKLRAENYLPTDLNDFTLEFADPAPDRFIPMAQALERLPVSPTYRMRLLEALCAFDAYCDRLCALVQPVAERLAPLLAPWAERSHELARQWEALFAERGLEFLSKRILYVTETVERCEFCLRYIDPLSGPCQGRDEEHIFCGHLGVGIPIRHTAQDGITENDQTMMRMLGNPARVRMLQAVMDTPMSSREMAKQLELHLGVATRDVRNMVEARLLITENHGGRIKYRANRLMLRTLARHLLAFAGDDEQ